MKAFTYYVDDTIRVFEKVTLNKPKSLFDDPFLGFHKMMHEKYDAKVQFNLFYEYENFNLSQMTDAYKQEWIENSDWLKFGFHSRSEFPDYPYCASTYDEVAKDYDLIMNEVKRFAGEQIISQSFVTHWLTLSKQGVEALRDKGGRAVTVTTGDEDRSPEIFSALSSGHRDRALSYVDGVSIPSICIRSTNGVSGLPYICNHNNLSNILSDKHVGKLENLYKDPETGVYFNRPAGITVNAAKLKDIPKVLDGLTSKNDYICAVIHEQYFYPDYFAYEKDYCDKVETVYKILQSKGYTNIAVNEVPDYQN